MFFTDTVVGILPSIFYSCRQLHEYYERWLMQASPHRPPAPVLVIDADRDLSEVRRDYEQLLPVILGEVPMSQGLELNSSKTEEREKMAETDAKTTVAQNIKQRTDILDED